MSKSKVSVDVRVDPSEKAIWQAEAQEQQTTVSELVRARMKDAGFVVATPAHEIPASPAPPAPAPLTRTFVDLDAAELESLRGWLALADSDGNADDELLTEWKAYAAASGVSFSELLRRTVLYVNVAHV
jgi:hypothetical protein